MISKRTEPWEWHKPPLAGAALLGMGFLILTFLAIITMTNRPFVTTEVLSKDDATDDLVRKEQLENLNNTINALEGALKHLFVVGDGVNLDLIFTVRLMEAQLIAFRHNVVLQNNTLTKHYFERLTKVQDDARKLQQAFTEAVRKNQPSYYKNMNFLLSAGSWELWYPLRNIDRRDLPTYEFAQTVNEDLEENKVDKCLKEPHAKQCQFTQNCWELMTHSFYNGYSLTHEIIYLLSAFALGCDKEAEELSHKWNNKTIDALLAKECAAVLHEAELFASRKFPAYHRDLFMEQISFCGLLGYRDFFEEGWLKEILSWQNEEGCYILNQTTAENDYARDFLPVFNVHIRKKRNELILADGCSAHMTGVALTALGQNVRFLMESIFSVEV